jgi:hypothetical protein
MDDLHDIRDGKLDTPKVYGCSSAIFGESNHGFRQ